MAFHEQTGHKVAIKILNKKKIRQYGVFEKVKRELKILRRFNNPHTIKLFEFIDTQTEIFMVLEYAAGGELFDLIARREKVSNISFIYQNKLDFCVCLVIWRWSEKNIPANYFEHWVFSLGQDSTSRFETREPSSGWELEHKTHWLRASQHHARFFGFKNSLRFS